MYMYAYMLVNNCVSVCARMTTNRFVKTIFSLILLRQMLINRITTNSMCAVIVYCQEWEVDQLLQFCMRNFILLIFAWSFKANIRRKYATLRRGRYKVNWRGGFAAPPF